MIGVINSTKIFEFRDETDLARAIDWLGNKYGCNSMIIVNTSDKIKGVVINENFMFMPDINEEEKYYIYGTTLIADDVTKNDPLPARRDWQFGPTPFAYVSQRIPKEIDIY